MITATIRTNRGVLKKFCNEKLLKHKSNKEITHYCYSTEVVKKDKIYFVETRKVFKEPKQIEKYNEFYEQSRYD